MPDTQTILKLVPSLRTRRLPDGRILLTRKFIEGANELHKFWGGPLHIYLECSGHQYKNLDEVAVLPDDFPFNVHILFREELARAIVADSAAIVLLSLDDCGQSGLASICRSNGVPCAWITEYSLATRKQIVDAGTANPLKRLRRKLWETNQEQKRRLAVACADGVQCNGTPTYESYRKLSPHALLYFDTRVSADMLVTGGALRERLAQLRSGGTLRLLYSGRLVAAKGVGHLIDLAKALRDRKVDFHLHICGDGDLKPWLDSQVASAQLSRNVTLDGTLDFQRQLLPFVKSGIDLFVCCHPQGDPSCTYLETMSCGVPIAGYANEAFEGVVKHSGCGWTVPVNRPDLLAERIALLSRMPESIAAMSLGSLAFATKHTFDRTFARRVEHLRALVAIARTNTISQGAGSRRPCSAKKISQEEER
jgi:colanic acid/amylovoran biosynthesis glycosyltransferase